MIEYFKSKKKLQRELEQAIEAIQYLNGVVRKLEKMPSDLVNEKIILEAERNVLRSEIEGLRAELNAVKTNQPTKLEKHIEAHCLESIERMDKVIKKAKKAETPSFSRLKSLGARDAYSLILSLIRRNQNKTR